METIAAGLVKGKAEFRIRISQNLRADFRYFPSDKNSNGKHKTIQ